METKYRIPLNLKCIEIKNNERQDSLLSKLSVLNVYDDIESTKDFLFSSGFEFSVGQ